MTSRGPQGAGEAPPCDDDRPRICFLYIAQAHQTLHSLSAAVELARARPDLIVEIAATSEDVLSYARRTAELLGPAPLAWRLLGPGWLRGVKGREGAPAKLPMLAANARTLGRYAVIVAPERTTAALKLFGVTAKLVYTQHGAGDRAGPFEPRLGRFDLVFAAGAKQRDRMVASGLVAAERCAVVGYPKFDLVDRLRPTLPTLFAEARPTVLYNPHFSAELGSWPRWGRQVLEAFAGQRRYNLIFAPHLRLSASLRRHAAALAPFRDLPHIHVDVDGGVAAIDMTYTRLADLYLGDVSSQVYEFIRTPRPCVFLNAGGHAWRADESYRHFGFGPVVEDIADLIGTIDAAVAAPARYAAVQAADFAYTFDLAGAPASVRAAAAIADLADTDRRVTAPRVARYG